ncbi:MAG TPA: ribonuclease H-like domain-containing protein [Candidatus Portnoybacteria bacterium]|nr:ribonuclease H-like domain-containing protein [Candidatus Portnoybacteria bacterium]
MSRIVFDIETIGVDFDGLSAEEQKYILKDSEDEKKNQEAKDRLGLSPLTGEVVAICLLNPDTNKGRVYFQAPGAKIKPTIEDGIEYLPMAEKELLEQFWQEIKNYDQYITFNGRKFDCPFLALRSGALKVRPTRNIMPYRYSDKEHIDLLDQLTFYDAFRKFSLDFYCRSFKLKSVKTEGMSGDKVQEYFKKGKYLEIAKYCADDVKATAELFERWEKYIRI